MSDRFLDIAEGQDLKIFDMDVNQIQLSYTKKTYARIAITSQCYLSM